MPLNHLPVVDHLHAAAIDPDDQRYMLAPQDEPPPDTLIASIKTFSILHPPLVKQIDSNRFVIVSGRKRVRAHLQTRPKDKLPCLILSSGTNELQVFSFLQEHSLLDGPLSIVQQASFFQKLLSANKEQKALPFLVKFGLKPNSHTLKTVLEVLNLPGPVKQALHEGTLKPVTARKIRALTEKEQDHLVNMIRRFHLGGSKQQRFVEMCMELARRRDVPIATILKDAPGGGGQLDNIPQQAGALLKWLSRECSPRLTEAETLFSKKLARLNLPSNLQVKPTQAFEDERLHLTVHCSDWDELQLVISRIVPKQDS